MHLPVHLQRRGVDDLHQEMDGHQALVPDQAWSRRKRHPFRQLGVGLLRPELSLELDRA